MSVQQANIDHRITAVSIGLFPIVLMLGIVLIPIVSDYSDHTIAAQAVSQTSRWFWGHLLSGLAFGYGAVVMSGLALHVFNKGVRWVITAIPLFTLGAALLTFGMGADGIGPVALATNNQPPHLFFDGSTLWIVSTFIGGTILFTVGQIMLLIGIQHTDLMSAAYGKYAMAAAILFSISSAIPAGWGLYLLGASMLIIYLPLSRAFWKTAAAPTLQII